MWTRFSKAEIQATSPSSSQPSLNFSSTCVPPGRSASPLHHWYSLAPTRSSINVLLFNTLLQMLRAALGTDRRSLLLQQSSQVSEENRTRQSGTWEAAATAGYDP